jgi:predicted RNase H-like nuclease (RuvC/YqgF family)
MPMGKITIYLPEEQQSEWKAQAKQQGLSTSEFVRTQVEKSLAKTKPGGVSQELKTENEELRRANSQLKDEIKRLKARNCRLRMENEQLKRGMFYFHLGEKGKK